MNKRNKIKKQNITKNGIEKKINREYKDRLFRKVFEKKEDLLELYNAVNGTNYKNPNELQVNTLEDVVYLGMKNDKSFLIGATMNLYEHMSTKSPNLPLRGLMYFSRLYEQYIANQNIRIYGKRPIQLPTPQYIVFYNGTEEEADRTELRLSDAFLQKDAEPAMECIAVVLNINYGRNKALLERCKRLEEYVFLVATVRKKLSEGVTLFEAVEQTVNQCIDQGILKDILLKNKAEVVGMILTEFDQEEYEKMIKEESYEDGVQQGVQQGIKLTKQVVKLYNQGKKKEEIAEQLKIKEEVIDAILN